MTDCNQLIEENKRLREELTDAINALTVTLDAYDLVWEYKDPDYPKELPTEPNEVEQLKTRISKLHNAMADVLELYFNDIKTRYGKEE